MREEEIALVHIFSAMGAGASCSVATAPLWMIKTRMMTQKKVSFLTHFLIHFLTHFLTHFLKSFLKVIFLSHFLSHF